MPTFIAEPVGWDEDPEVGVVEPVDPDPEAVVAVLLGLLDDEHAAAPLASAAAPTTEQTTDAT
jgi:hypothetical protein